MSINPGWIAELPKVELHTHLEGTLTTERIAQLADSAGVVLPRPADRLFEFDNLAEFLDLIALTCGLVRRPEDAEQVAYDLAESAAHDGLVYQEVMLTPLSWGGLPRELLVEAVAAGFDRAVRDGHTDCRLLVTLVRRQSQAEAIDFVRWLGDSGVPRVVGLGLEGDESLDEGSSGRFAEAYAMAREFGLGRTAHTGESSGPDGVRDTLDQLHVSRLDHGIRSAEDPELMARLAAAGVACNVCLASNLALVDSDPAKHPLPELILAGVPVTVNTDDWVRFGPLSKELIAVTDLLDWTRADIANATRTAIDIAFCDEPKKAELRASLDAFMNTAATEEHTR